MRVDFSYKHSRVKQYLKEGRALRIETVINKPADIGVLARLEHLAELVERARTVNDRLLRIERAGQGCAIGSALFERIHQPYVREGQRTGGLALRGSTRHGPWAEANNVELAYVQTNASWLNRIEAQFQALRYFTLDGTDHRSHEEQNSMIRRYISWRNRNTQDKTLRELVKWANVA